MSLHSCIACEADRVDKGFCQIHLDKHNNSKWVQAWNLYQQQCKTVGVKKAIWIAP